MGGFSSYTELHSGCFLILFFALFAYHQIDYMDLQCCGIDICSMNDLKLHSGAWHFEKNLKQKCLFCERAKGFSSWKSFRDHLRRFHPNAFVASHLETQCRDENNVGRNCESNKCINFDESATMAKYSVEEPSETRSLVSAILNLNLLKDKHSVPDTVANKIFVEGIEACAKFSGSIDALKRVCGSTYMQNKVLDEFCRTVGHEITVDSEKFYYVSIYDKIRSLLKQKYFIEEVLKDKRRKFHLFPIKF